MTTFQEIYCARERCSASEFRHRVFAAALPWYARLLGPVVRALNQRHFAADHQLIDAASRAETVEQLRVELRTYVGDPSNRRWLRRSAKIRVSTRRLLRLARAYLPDGKR